MKRLIAAVIILAAVLTIVIIGMNTIFSFGAKIENKVNSVLKAKDDELYDKAKDFIEYWEKKRELLSIFVNHSDINEIGITAAELVSFAKTKKRDEMEAAANEILFMIYRIKEDESFSLFTFL